YNFSLVANKYKLLTKCGHSLTASAWVHLRSSPLYAPDYSCSLFFLPFNTSLLLSQHREAVWHLRLNVDTDGPTIIFYTARIKQALSFTAHFGKSGGSVLRMTVFRKFEVCASYEHLWLNPPLRKAAKH